MVVGAVSLGLSAVGMATSYIDGHRQRKEDRRREKLRKAALMRGFELETQALRRQQGQIAFQTQVQVTGLAEAAKQRRGLAAASQASGNVAGQSVYETIQDFTRQEAAAIAQVGVAERFANANVEASIKAAAVSLEIDLLNAEAPRRGRPNIPADVLQAVGAAAQLQGAVDGLDLFGNGGATTVTPKTTTTSAVPNSFPSFDPFGPKG